MTLEIWQIWVTAAIVLFICEIFTPGFLLACLGVACLGAGLAAGYDAGLKVQILTFSVTALVVFAGVRPLFMRYFYRSSRGIKTNVEALIGKTGVVMEKIEPAPNKGRVTVGSEDWKAVSYDGKEIESGRKVTVIRIEGVKLVVEEEKSA